MIHILKLDELQLVCAYNSCWSHLSYLKVILATKESEKLSNTYSLVYIAIAWLFEAEFSIPFRHTRLASYRNPVYAP